MTRIQNVADTAFLTAYCRAVESGREDALFRDPLAAAVLTERGRAMGEASHASLLGGWSVVIRTVVIDGMIANALAHGVDVVVNLGAGLDTRPYRLELPATLRWMEVDQENLIQHKNTALAGATPRCVLERVAADLTDTRQRGQALQRLHAHAGKVLVITEGVVPYWAMETVAGFADDLRSIPGVWGWIVDHLPPHVVAARRQRGLNSENAELKFDPPDWHAFFAQRRWRPAAMHNLYDAGERLGRPMPRPPGAPPVPADAQARTAAFPGYAMLEPVA